MIFSAKSQSLSLLSSSTSLSPFTSPCSLRRQFLGSGHFSRPPGNLRYRKKWKKLGFHIHSPKLVVRASISSQSIVLFISVVTVSAIAAAYLNYCQRNKTKTKEDDVGRSFSFGYDSSRGRPGPLLVTWYQARKQQTWSIAGSWTLDEATTEKICFMDFLISCLSSCFMDLLISCLSLRSKFFLASRILQARFEEHDSGKQKSRILEYVTLDLGRKPAMKCSSISWQKRIFNSKT